MENSDELSADRLRQIESRWKSDVDLKLDKMLRFAEKYEGYLILCLKREQERDELRQALTKNLLGSVILAGMAMLGIAAWQYIKEHLK